MNKQSMVPESPRDSRIREVSDFIFMRLQSPDRHGFPGYLAEQLVHLNDCTENLRVELAGQRHLAAVGRDRLERLERRSSEAEERVKALDGARILQVELSIKESVALMGCLEELSERIERLANAFTSADKETGVRIRALEARFADADRNDGKDSAPS